jgi:hypothetical protein
MPRSADSVNAIPLLSVNENEELKRTLFSQIIMWAHSLEPSGYPAVFASLSEEISRPLNDTLSEIFLSSLKPSMRPWPGTNPIPMRSLREKYRSEYDQIVTGANPHARGGGAESGLNPQN